MTDTNSLRSIDGLFALGLALLVVLGAIAVAGRSPWPNRTEQLQVSVRDNPSSWRPTYTVYHPYSSSGGGSSGSSGGFSGGK
jgi:hypothetical protein